MIKWDHRHTLILILMFLGLGGISNYAHSYLIEPKQQAVEEIENRLVTQQQLIETIESEGLTEEDLRAEREAIEFELPKDQAIDQLIIMLDDLKNDSSLVIHRIEKLSDAPVSESQDYAGNMKYINHKVDFSVNRYSDFEQFIQELSNSNRRIEIEQLNFQQTSTNGVSGTVVYRAFYSE